MKLGVVKLIAAFLLDPFFSYFENNLTFKINTSVMFLTSNSCIYFSGMKKMNKGPSFKINSVSINAQAILKAEEDLKPLADAMPDTRDARKGSVSQQLV